MRKSILQSFKDSGIAPGNIKKAKQRGWSGTVFDRASAIDMEDAYLGIFGLPSHVVHGNWQDLLAKLLRMSGLFGYTVASE